MLIVVSLPEASLLGIVAITSTKAGSILEIASGASLAVATILMDSRVRTKTCSVVWPRYDVGHFWIAY